MTAGGIIARFNKYVDAMLGLSATSLINVSRIFSIKVIVREKEDPMPGPDRGSSGETALRNFSAISHWCFLALALELVWPISGPALAAQKQVPTVSAAPGTLVRWSAPGTKRCRMNERSWPALEETCYYPIDLLQKPGIIRITR